MLTLVQSNQLPHPATKEEGMKIEIKDRWDGNVILCGEHESIKDALEKNKGANLEGAYLRGADLGDANLEGANLRCAYLGDANLEGANLRGAKSYADSHDFFREIIYRQEVGNFAEKEWAMIGVILVHRICWDSIKKRYGKKVMSIFNKLAKVGFDEWEKKYSEVLKED